MQGKTGWWITGICGTIILIGIGHGMGQRSRAASNTSATLSPAGAPLPAVQIEPIQPHEEMAAITATPASSTTSSAKENQPASFMQVASVLAPSRSSPGPAPLEESARVKEIQRALKTAGFDPGPIDGQMGNRTKTAVLDFQRANGLQADGKVGPRTWNKLESYLKGNAKENSGKTSSND